MSEVKCFLLERASSISPGISISEIAAPDADTSFTISSSECSADVSSYDAVEIFGLVLDSDNGAEIPGRIDDALLGTGAKEPYFSSSFSVSELCSSLELLPDVFYLLQGHS